jgi:hypothetical protein
MNEKREKMSIKKKLMKENMYEKEKIWVYKNKIELPGSLKCIRNLKSFKI